MRDMKRETFIKAILIAAAVLVAVMIVTAVTDCIAVFGMHRKPVFAVPSMTADDGGSGTYRGLLHTFEIDGRFMPEEDGAVESARLYLFGIPAADMSEPESEEL